jgi:4-amino-4-deoxy-L-arabinose transferase-like glycosyltransferase
MRHERIVVIACMVVYFTLAVALANVRAPQSDEGHFAEAAASIATTGRFIMPTWTPWLPSLDQRVYAVMPAYFFGLAGWFRLFGVGMLRMRYFSVLWGGVLVFSYYLLVRKTSGDRVLGMVALLLLALNYDLINLTTARYDGMAAGLSALGLATYGMLRERHFAMSIVLANTCIALAAMTHPYGAFGFVYVVILFLTLDRDRLKLSLVLLAAVPYIVALAGWGLYIAQDPAMFRAQFGANAAGHAVSLFHPLAAIGSDLHDRYWLLFGGVRQGAPPYMRLKLAVLFLYLVSLVASLLTAEIRREKMNRAVLACAAFGFLALAFGEGSRGYIYLVHVIGFYILLVAIWTRHLIRLGGWRRGASITIIAGLAIFTVATITYRARLNSYKNGFLAAANYLQQHLSGQQFVFAGGDFGVPLGFAEHVLDDRLLGSRSQKRADYIVIDRDYATSFQAQRLKRPDVYAKTMQSLQTYKLVFESRVGPEYYRVYARDELNSGQDHVDPSTKSAH